MGLLGFGAVEFQNPSDLVDCFRILVGRVIGGDDFFGLRFGDVGTPIRHDTVGFDGFGFIFVAAQSAVASDDMHGHWG